MQRVIGIDFGTSTTYMNVKRYNGDQPVEGTFSYMPVMFNYGGANGYVPTIIRENTDGSFDFGEKAMEQIDGSKIYTEIKMQLESPDETQRNEARRIVKEFFKFLYATYAQQTSNLGSPDDTEQTIISYPVKWQKATSTFMLEAAREAGFPNVRGMDEATAAIYTVLCHKVGEHLLRVDHPGYLLLVDMGAGTTDLVVCKYQADSQGHVKVAPVNNWPRDKHEPTFGGREVDRVLEGYVERYLSKALSPSLAPSAGMIAATPGQAKLWKERNVSVNLANNKPVTTCAYIGTYRSMGMLTGDFPAFDRKTFEEFAQEGLHDYVKLLEGCLEDAARKDTDFATAGIDLVILAGGHSSWYFAREILDGTMEGYLTHPALARVREQKNHVVNLANPQTTVSLGLVYSKLPFDLSEPEPESGEIEEEESIEEVEESDDTLCCSDWDEAVLPVVRNLISTEARLVQTNQMNDAEVLAKLREQMKISNSETVLYAALADSTGQQAALMTEKGIFRSFHNEETDTCHILFMSWKDFINSSALNQDENTVVFCYGDNCILFSSDKLNSSMSLVYERLRQEVDLELVDLGATLLQTIQTAISSAPDLCNSNMVGDEAVKERLRSVFDLPSEERVLYAVSPSDDSRNGLLMTGRGIYQAADGPESVIFMSWREFAHSKIAAETAQTRTYKIKGRRIVTHIQWNRGGMNRLYGNLQDALGMEKVSPYKWDPCLLSIVKQFIRENDTFKKRGICPFRQEPALLSKLELRRMCNDEIYYVADNNVNNLFGKGKEIITSSGFGVRNNYLLSYNGDIITWEEFIEADLNNNSAKATKVVCRHMRMADDFIQLQQLLRQEALKLN